MLPNGSSNVFEVVLLFFRLHPAGKYCRANVSISVLFAQNPFRFYKTMEQKDHCETEQSKLRFSAYWYDLTTAAFRLLPVADRDLEHDSVARRSLCRQ